MARDVGNPEDGEEQQTKTRTLFFVALLLSAFQVTLVETLERQTLYLFSGISGFFLGGLVINILSFLINPVLLFYVFYNIGKRVQLEDRYVFVGASIFVGGVVGYTVPYFLVPVAYGGSWSAFFPDFGFFLATASSLGLVFIGAGLGVLFPGFVAIVVANYRTKKQPVPNEQATQPNGNPSQT